MAAMESVAGGDEGQQPVQAQAASSRSATMTRDANGVVVRHGGVHLDRGGLGDILKVGVMEKYGTSMMAGWQKRTFQLYKTGLTYFTDKQDHAKVIKMGSISNIRLVDMELHLTWEELNGKEKIHRLRAENNDETVAWEKAIKDAWGYSASE